MTFQVIRIEQNFTHNLNQPITQEILVHPMNDNENRRNRHNHNTHNTHERIMRQYGERLIDSNNSLCQECLMPTEFGEILCEECHQEVQIIPEWMFD